VEEESKLEGRRDYIDETVPKHHTVSFGFRMEFFDLKFTLSAASFTAPKTHPTLV
jgi:hypothetical protein